ncbi:hypothetical protein PspLS_03520 [Pyricularia sp. CBS 133598]|nr:hypothetical protein PspLS_03520 [Pyricularia sp. CBS 133598]
MSGWYASTKIWAICRHKVNGKILREFTIKANAGLRPPYEVLLLASPDDDLQKVLTATSALQAFESANPLNSGYSAMNDLWTGFYRNEYGTNSRGDTLVPSDVAIVQLFEPFASNHSLCFVCVPVKKYNIDFNQDEETIGFPCKFDHVPQAIAALDDLDAVYCPAQRARVMRNEAVCCGGVWDPTIMSRLRASEGANQVALCSHLDFVSYPPFRGQATAEANPRNARGRLPLTPLFITAEVSLDTVNEFLKATEDKQDMRADERFDRYAIITNLDPAAASSTAGAAIPPLQALPQIPRELLHATPEACITFARSRFPGQKELMKWDEFVVLDEFTESQKTAILGTWDGERGPVLIRSDFDELWLIQAVVSCKPPTHDSHADDASRTEDGVYRGCRPLAMERAEQGNEGGDGDAGSRKYNLRSRG